MFFCCLFCFIPPSSQDYGFSSGHVWMWELDYKESWASKNWRFWTVVLEKTLESPLDCKGIQPVHSKGDQSWVFIGRANAKAETTIPWPPHVKSWLIGKTSDAGKDWGQEEKGTIEDEMAGWHHWLSEHESEWTPGVGDGQGGLACCNSCGRKELDTTEWLNWTELRLFHPWCFQARILEWGAISSSRGSSWPRDQTWVSCISCIDRWTLYHWATIHLAQRCM